ncbi:MAG: aminotransferase class V-fold PLP-dependent enzyme [Pseudomonadota bacterium]
MSAPRAYLDWNASAPLRPEARDAMRAAMDESGNPSSVHAEGRKAKAIVERARAQVADLAGCSPGEVIFTSGATESVAAVIGAKPWRRILTSGVEHDAVEASVLAADRELHRLGTAKTGAIALDDAGEHPQEIVGAADDEWLLPCSSGPLYGREASFLKDADDLLCLQAANGETGVYHQLDRFIDGAGRSVTMLCDLTQVAGRPIKAPDNAGGAFSLRDPMGEHYREGVYSHGAMSAHKLGGPKGVGAIISRGAADLGPFLSGGGQEHGRRAGTENTIGIAGFGAAAEAAKRDLEAGVWDQVENLRNIIEYSLEAAAPDLTFIGRDAPRLPNTSCFAMPEWKGETQVMQMDLAGFAVSAGSACSSGKVNRASRVLLAMGFDETTASSAIRVSLGPTNTEAEVRAFADAWIAAYRRWKAKAA